MKGCHGLIVLVVADHATAGVRRENLGGQEMLAGKRTLAGAAGADQDDERQVGDGDSHSSTEFSRHGLFQDHLQSVLDNPAPSRTDTRS